MCFFFDFVFTFVFVHFNFGIVRFVVTEVERSED